VFGAFLLIIGITATAQAALVSTHVATSTMNAVVASDAATVRAVLNDTLQVRDLEVGPSASTAQARLRSELRALTEGGGVLRVELRRLDGTIVAASDPARTGAVVTAAGDVSDAAAGTPRIAIVPETEAGAGPGILASSTLLREFLPISTGGEVRGVVGIWRDAVPLLRQLDGVRRDVVTVTLSAALVAALVLLLIFLTAIIGNLSQGRKPDCRCFGQLRAAPIGASTVVFNVALIAIAILCAWSPGPSIVDWLDAFPMFDHIAIVTGAIAMIGIAAIGWLLWRLLQQQQKLFARLEQLESRLAGASMGPAKSTHEGLPVGSKAPPFALDALGGGHLTLDNLLAAGKPVLVEKYALPRSAFCRRARAAGVMAVRKKLALGAWRRPCW